MKSLQSGKAKSGNLIVVKSIVYNLENLDQVLIRSFLHQLCIKTTAIIPNMAYHSGEKEIWIEKFTTRCAGTSIQKIPITFKTIMRFEYTFGFKST